MAIYLITDTHLGHDKLVEYTGRPKNFTEQILALSNVTLQPDDTLIHLGDIAMGRDSVWNAQLMMAIAKDCQKILVRGNHDKRSKKWYYERGWNLVVDQGLHHYHDGLILDFRHEPTELERGDLQIHGHCHGKSSGFSAETHVDMAPELWGYAPIALDEVIEKWRRLTKG